MCTIQLSFVNLDGLFKIQMEVEKNKSALNCTANSFQFMLSQNYLANSVREIL
jgi:hypothetical protein